MAELPDALTATAVRDGDLATIAQPLDFLGVNYCNTNFMRVSPPGSAQPIEEAPPPAKFARTAMGWPVDPQGMTEMLLGLRDRYGSALPPIIITENGAAFTDTVARGAVHDADRIAFLDSHIRAVRKAMDAGIDVRGYLVWSILDNFEWADGYGPRFGLVRVDYATQRRTPKDSYYWYRKLIAAPDRAASSYKSSS